MSDCKLFVPYLSSLLGDFCMMAVLTEGGKIGRPLYYHDQEAEGRSRCLGPELVSGHLGPC